MKKLVLLLVLVVFLSLFSVAQPIIKIHGDADALAMTTLVEESMDYLGIHHKALILDVVFTELMPKRLKGLTLVTPAPDDEKDTIKVYRIRIDARLDDVQRLNVLAHEMMHVKQYVVEDLKIDSNYKIVWKGKKYPFADYQSRKTPWELEAYRHDQYVAKFIREAPQQTLPLAVKTIP